MARRSRKSPPQALPLQQELARYRATEAVYLMRTRGLSLTRAAREARADPRTVKRYFGSALRQLASGRYRATPSDRIPRRMHVLTSSGVIDGIVVGSRHADLIAEHAGAVAHYFDTGDASRVRAFQGVRLRIDGRWREFATDLRDLRRRQYAGLVSFEELYVYAG